MLSLIDVLLDIAPSSIINYFNVMICKFDRAMAKN